MRLRGYQQAQINFIKARIDTTNIVGIESPTGSGKTIVFLEFIKEWMNQPENHLTNVVISTGFNKLVFLLEKRAKELGIDTKVLIGTKAVNCPIMASKNGIEYQVFSESEECRCGEKHKYLDDSNVPQNKKVCPYTREAYQEHYNGIKTNVGQLIITNHSSLLIHQQALSNTSLLIIDEAHTFGVFYDSFLKLELDKSDLTAIDKAINKIPEPMRTIIKRNIGLGVDLPSVQIDRICEAIEDKMLQANTREFFNTKKSLSNYIEKTSDSYVINKFYKSFELDIKPKIILFSATLDKYTLNMFNVGQSYFYKEFTQFCDYKKSEFLAIPEDDFSSAFVKFLDYVSMINLDSGLCLSTTITDMKIALTYNGYNDYKMFTEREEFENYKNGKKILVGSRSLFQGVDIADLNFVCLNKIPFPTWDDKAKALQEYLTDSGKNHFDAWRGHTIPKTENDIIQAFGRLWRDPKSAGLISIFDSRVEKFKYIMRDTIEDYRHGIKSNIMRKDGKIEPFDIS